MIYRIYVQRKPGFDNEGKALLADLRDNLGVGGLTAVRCVNRYDVEGVSPEIFKAAKHTVFSEPQRDIVTTEPIKSGFDFAFTVEYLPGQFDQRADSCEQCIQILTLAKRPRVRTAKSYLLSGEISDDEREKIKNYIINPIDSREASEEIPVTLADKYDPPAKVKIIDGFISLEDDEIEAFINEWGLAMDVDDVKFCREYFKNDEKRNPTLTELRLIDTYWSDHCRHTTFLTAINGVDISDEYIRESYEEYLKQREFALDGRKRPVTLMDIATIGAKYLKKTGQLVNIDESEEINACSVKVQIEVDGKPEEWLMMFKNETHNHPTEIEPFGGASTCLGGAIRDPLSGRSYVYQAMRVTGAADPRTPISKTLPGKLPQSKLTKDAAAGYSSYGNQIGLATGGVYELYHPDYVAKRLETGAVVGAAPASNVRRETPAPGDVVILLGGRTGRDGCGGATGSSKSQTVESLATSGAEVQKGNAPEERKMQRLFRDSAVTKLIKRCNDFGAGGVSVAIGELADGLDIDLSAVPVKYEGLDGTELAVSESQERMAVVVSENDADEFIRLAEAENLEATPVAKVNDKARLRMVWNGDKIVDLSREFLSSNGAPKSTDVNVLKVDITDVYRGIPDCLAVSNNDNSIKKAFYNMLSDLNICSQKGLSERFDSTIGAASVVLPYGGRHQLTAPQYMAAKFPVLVGETDDASVMAYGFNPYLSKSSPYHGAVYAVIDSITKLVAAGILYSDCYLTFQEYYERNNGIPERWGKPFAALLGALKVQTSLGIASVGGKDSMSGSFEDIDVPPTLISFAIAAGKASKLVTPEFKAAKSRVYLLAPSVDNDLLPDFNDLKRIYSYVNSLAASGIIKSAYALGFGGVAEAIVKMALGNGIGFDFEPVSNAAELFEQRYGAIIVETNKEIDGELIGFTSDRPEITINQSVMPLFELEDVWKRPLESIFPLNTPDSKYEKVNTISYNRRPTIVSNEKFASPRVAIPVFPGTNCEYETVRRFELAGGSTDVLIVRNLTPDMLEESLAELAQLIKKSQILMLPGGLSSGGEPDGSAKFITAVLRNPRISEAVTDLIENRTGLILGISDGFQALLKSGLLPNGRIADTVSADAPTLTYNTIGRHQSMMVHTRIASVDSPWLTGVSVGDIHALPISHAEGRFTANGDILEKLADSGRIAAQYVDENGNPTTDIRYNPSGSDLAVEGLLSADGRIFGKMGHSERIGENIAKNIPGNKDQRIFESGINFFK